MISDVPESFDIREQWPECKREVRDQESCSPMIFAAVEVLGWRFCIATEGKTNLVLSVQDIISCDLYSGCQGGFPESAWEYFETSGVVTESCFPYEGFDAPCRTECVNGEEWVKYKSTAIQEFTNPSEIKDNLFKSGPIQTSFTVYSDFVQYEGGIYKHTSGGLLGGHTVFIIGWGVQDGTNYWIAQNSWGKDWGEQGYFRIAEGECGFDENGIAGEAVVEKNINL